MRYESMQQVRAANAAAGGHWFDADALRFFGSRISDTLYGGRFFVSSEQDRNGSAWDGARRYTVREALPGGRIETVGQFGMFDTRREAVAFARQCARALEGWIPSVGFVGLAAASDVDAVAGWYCSVSCAWPSWTDGFELRGAAGAPGGTVCGEKGCYRAVQGWERSGVSA